MQNIQNITLKLEVTIASEVNFTRLARCTIEYEIIVLVCITLIHLYTKNYNERL